MSSTGVITPTASTENIKWSARRLRCTLSVQPSLRIHSLYTHKYVCMYMNLCEYAYKNFKSHLIYIQLFTYKMYMCILYTDILYTYSFIHTLCYSSYMPSYLHMVQSLGLATTAVGTPRMSSMSNTLVGHISYIHMHDITHSITIK